MTGLPVLRRIECRIAQLEAETAELRAARVVLARFLGADSPGTVSIAPREGSLSRTVWEVVSRLAGATTGTVTAEVHKAVPLAKRGTIRVILSLWGKQGKLTRDGNCWRLPDHGQIPKGAKRE